MTDHHVPRFAHGRIGSHAASIAPGSVGRGAVAALAVVALVASAAYGMNMMTEPDVDAAVADIKPEATPSPEPSPEPAEPVVETLPWGPTVEDWDYAVSKAESMSVEEAAGQVLIANFSGKSPADVASMVDRYHLGGVILFDDNIGDATRTTRLNQAIQDAGAQSGRTWPVIVSVDQEGGPVARLTPLVPEMPAFMAAGAVADKQVVEDTYSAFGSDIGNLGFNVNYAPVADMTIGLQDPVIRTRSAGSDPDNVSATVVAAVNGYLNAGVVPTVKHFPGHGSVTTDSHAALPTQRTKVKELAQRDFVPFQAAIDAGAPLIMMGHVRIPEWGKGPSTLNPRAYSYLRDQMGFQGVIVTDALNMAAVTKHRSPDDVAVGALKAGADLLLMPADLGEAHAGIVKAVKKGKLDRARLNDAAAHSIALMSWQSRMAPEVPPGTDYVRAFSAAGATVAASSCGKNYVKGGVRISGGWQSERDALARALKKLGVPQKSTGTTITILGSADGKANSDIVVAMDGPWGLPDSNANVYVGLYGRGDATLAGLADVLTGTVTPTAGWPVHLSGIKPDACTGGG